MASVQMWTSKLGNKYPMSQIQEKDRQTQAELKRLRALKCESNNRCADCDSADNSWASVTHGVFICIVCSDVHRSVGTHISKMKGCTGTYLWGPDELSKMQSMGNRRASEVYGSRKVAPDASKETKQRFVLEKYREPRCVDAASAEPPAAIATAAATEQPPTSLLDSQPLVEEKPLTKVIRRAPVSAAAWEPHRAGQGHGRLVATKADIPDDFFDSIFGEEESATQQPPVAKQLPSAAEKKQEATPFFGFDFDDLLGEATVVVAAK